jgi:cation:H+ antiporter
MLVQLLWLVAGLLLLYAGAEGLVRGASSLARRLRVSPLVIGLTVVAFGTSMPEVVVSVRAALDGEGSIAVGNAIGSNIFNVGAILGIAAIVAPIKIKIQLLRFDVPVMMVIALALLFIFPDATIDRWEGAVLIAMLAIYVGFNIYFARRERNRRLKKEFAKNLPKQTMHWQIDAVLIVLGLVSLTFGARFMVSSAVTMAEALSVDKGIVALTIVAAGTGLPELAASVIAAWRRASDIAVGNIIGSNILNMVGALGVGSLVRPLATAGISPVNLYVMIGFFFLLVPFLWHGFKLNRWEGAVLFGLYLCYLVYHWSNQSALACHGI